MGNESSKRGAYIIAVTDKSEAVCAAGGRISTQNGTALEIFERSQDKEKNEKLIRKVTSSGHNSTVEHIFFNLAFENVSVVVEQFMIEFRLASFTVKSRRYVDFSSSGYFVPDTLSDTHRERYCRHMDGLFELYTALCEQGIEKEDARFVLPYCFYSNFFCSLNGRELLLVLRRMLYGSAAAIKEIRDIGLQLLEQGRRLAPGVFAEFEQRKPSLPDRVQLQLSLPEVLRRDASRKKPLCELISCVPDGAKAVAESFLIADGSYADYDVQKIVSDRENVRHILREAVASSRPRCLEAANYTFRINGVSLACITHFARHRVQSIAVPPLMTADRGSFVIPQAVCDHPALLEKYKEAFTSTEKLYKELKAQGVSEQELVYCLLSGNTLDIVTTVNARELWLFFRLRTCNRAQWEIRAYANAMLSLLRQREPELFFCYGPSCYCEGRCPEGKLSCGKAAQMQQQYASQGSCGGNTNG